jgi:hypothetical protein
MPEIIPLHLNDAAIWGLQLVELLQDAVDGGASVGFLAPLSDADARQYWTEVFSEVGLQSRIVLAAVQQDEIVGSVQLEPARCPMPCTARKFRSCLYGDRIAGTALARRS